MRRQLFYHLLLFLFCAASSHSMAEGLLPHITEEKSKHPPQEKTMLVVEFGEKSPSGSKLGDAIQQAKKEFSPVESTVLPDSHALESLLENKTDGSIGLVVLIHPQDMDTLARLPALYPDILFTLIDVPQPTYAANVQSVQFKEIDGAFLLGAIAAIRTTSRISVLAMEEDAYSKLLAESFIAGVNRIRPQASLHSLMNVRASLEQHTRLATLVGSEFQEGSTILFSMNDEIVEQALRAAKPERKMVISANPPPAHMESSRLLTYLVKRYDLALLDVLRIYTHGQWHAGTIELGLSGGYVDYSLNADNVELFPKEAIDQIEIIKDYLSQGIYNKTP